MRHMLAAHNVTLTLGWHIRRDAPLAGTHGGPECGGVQVVPLAAETRAQLVSVLQVRPAPARQPTAWPCRPNCSLTEPVRGIEVSSPVS